MSRATAANPSVSVVLPCLDEGGTVGDCVREAAKALAACGVKGEVIVADNGSCDSSVRAARSAGARVIVVSRRGYGAAVLGGVAAARGRLVVMADADSSYDLSAIPVLLAELKRKGGLIVGSRLRGTVLRGAMPVSHRLIGTPLFNILLRVLFGLRVSDSQSGMRAFAKKTFVALGLRSSGMEFATEMLARAAQANVEISEVPIRYRRAGSGRATHLRTFSDGWRHLKLLLFLGPPSFLLAPGILAFAAGAAMMAASLLRISVFGHRADVNFAVFGSGLAVAGHQVVHLGLGSVVMRGKIGKGRTSRFLLRALSLEGVLFPSALLVLAGIVIDLLIFLSWVAEGFPAVSTATTSLAIAGTTLILLAGGMIFGGFLLDSLSGAGSWPERGRKTRSGRSLSA